MGMLDQICTIYLHWELLSSTGHAAGIEMLSLIFPYFRLFCVTLSFNLQLSSSLLISYDLIITVQTIPARSFPKQIGNKPITSAYFNNHSQILVVGCMDLSIFIPDLEKEELIK